MLLERGADTLVTHKPAGLRLCERLGLGDRLVFKPMVPPSYGGERTLAGLRYRGATLDIDQLKHAFTTAASTQFGATGWTVLAAGDRPLARDRGRVDLLHGSVASASSSTRQRG